MTTEMPDNPFEMNGGTTSGGQSQPADQTPGQQPAGNNPFSMSPSEAATMGTPAQTDQNSQGETTQQPNQSAQPAPDLTGGSTMQNQAGGFNPNQGFGNPNPGGQPGGNPPFNPGNNQNNNPGFGGPAQNNNPGFAQPNQQPNQGGGFGQPNQQPNPGGFGQPNQQQNSGGQQQKYIIVDFFWWINKKIINQQQMNQGETAILTVGYNASFNNLRFSFHNADNTTFSPSSITMQNAPRASMCNIYAEQAIELLSNKGTGKTVHAFERVIKAGNWTPNQTQITWNQDNVIIQTTDNQGAIYTFACVEEQILGLEKAFEFLVNGIAWNISLHAAMNR